MFDGWLSIVDSKPTDLVGNTTGFVGCPTDLVSKPTGLVGSLTDIVGKPTGLVGNPTDLVPQLVFFISVSKDY